MVPRSFSSIFNIGHSAPAFLYIYDPNAVVTGDNQPVTGCQRPAQPSDFATTISGGLTIGNVGVTGGSITIANPSLNVVINSGTYVPNFAALSAGQVSIPIGAKQASISVASGVASINGSVVPAGVTVKIGGYDGHFTLANAVNVGCTGAAFVSWDT